MSSLAPVTLLLQAWNEESEGQPDQFDQLRRTIRERLDAGRSREEVRREVEASLADALAGADLHIGSQGPGALERRVQAILFDMGL